MLRRDLWLLPFKAVLTVIALLAAPEVAVRLGWPEQTANACRMADPVLGFRYRPNCISKMKSPEDCGSKLLIMALANGRTNPAVYCRPAIAGSPRSAPR